LFASQMELYRFFLQFGLLIILTGVTRTMPIYEYECTSCCTTFEVFQRMTESPLKTCPDCAGAVKKLVSISSFQLKGSGWYADGYSSKASAGSDTNTAAAPAKNVPEKAEKKPSSSADSSSAPQNKKSCSATA